MASDAALRPGATVRLGWQPIEAAPENVRDGAAFVHGVAGHLRCRAYTPDGITFFALWTGPSHGDPVTHFQPIGEPPHGG